MKFNSSLRAYTVPFVTLLLLSACGKFDKIENGGFTEVSFKGSRAGHFLTTSTLTNGILITAYGSSYVTNLSIADESVPTSIVLPNGTYSFYAFGYAYSIHDAGTDMRCAVAGDTTPVVLNGTAQTITLDFRQSHCANGAFTPSSAYLDATMTSTLPNSGPVFAPLDFIHCSTAAGTSLSTVASSQDCSTSAGTGLTAVYTNAVKFQKVFPIFKYQGGVFTRMGEAYRSSCSTNATPSSSGQVANSQYVRYPVGITSKPYAFPIEIESFTDASCTSTPVMVNKFHKGLIFGASPDASYMGTALATSSRVRVFLRAP